ncbi:MAG: FMN-binding protein [Lachnospiraceae bacterium]
MKKTAKTIGIIAGILCVIIVGFFIVIHVYTTTATKDINIQTTDAAGVSDGTYTGSYEIESVKVSVQVTVADEKITDITILEHQNGLGGKAESIIDQVIENQSLEVDAVSGATASSKTILKAIENALLQGV